MKLIASNIQLLKTLAMAAAVVMIVAGIAMVFMGIQDQGYIDLKTPVLEGKLKYGFVGVALIFLAIVVILACFFFRYKDSIEVEVGDVKVKTKGYLGPERLAALAAQMKGLLESREGLRQQNKDQVDA